MLNKKRLMSFFVLMAAALLLALPLTASAEMVKKVDNFILFLDQSGSMVHHALPGVTLSKNKQALATIERLDQIIPELGYNGAGAVFAKYKTVSEPAVYKNGSLSPAFYAVTPGFNQWTPMGEGIGSIGGMVDGLSGKTALIIFTDGDSNTGTDAVAEAKSLYQAHPGKLCIHVVSFADTPNGERVIADIRALSDCSVATDIQALGDDAALAAFAKAVLYDDVMPKPKPAPKPEPKPVVQPAPVVQKEVITFNLLFGFDKSAITDEMVPILENAKMILEEDPAATFNVAGHTDWTGPEVYNQGLSERRATSVRNWLVGNGIPADRLSVVGYGETSPKYDNNTKEGRRLNRRVELVSSPTIVK
ncbi:MAG: flagellar motor protein MotB [Desulfuromonas sp.]|nr:MAG: flagellar motor protein MotB [Desulfuromonas sp.]